MTIWETPVKNLPWYHKLWAYPLNWVMVKIANGLNKLAEQLRK